MSDAVNMIELVAELQRRPRGRACVVLTQDYFEQKSWAAKLAQQTGGTHLDLLELFTNNDELSRNLSTFSIKTLFDLLRNHTDNPLLIVSGIEFLKATWAGQSQAVEEFARRLETWNTTPAIFFVMQFDQKLAARKFTRFPNQVFVVDQRDTLALV